MFSAFSAILCRSALPRKVWFVLKKLRLICIDPFDPLLLNSSSFSDGSPAVLLVEISLGTFNFPYIHLVRNASN